MEQSNKIFGVTSTTSAVQSFSGVAASGLFSNPFAAVTTATTVASFSSVFGQSPAFTSNANTTTSSSSFPFARFNFSAPSFPAQNSTILFSSASEPSSQSITTSKDSDVQILFGKQVPDETKKVQSEQEVKNAQLSQLEPKRRWNAKADDERRASASLFGRTLASIARQQHAGRSAAEAASASNTDMAVSTTESSTAAGDDILSTATPSASAASRKAIRVRRLSSEDTSLIVKCIPDEYCNKSPLRNHFAKYGISRVYVNSRTHSATVVFHSHHQAAAAHKDTHTLPDGSVLQTFWRAASSGNRRASVGTDSSRKTSKHGATLKARSTSKEVEDELASMRGTKDTDDMAYLDRRQIRSVCNVEEDPRTDTRSAAGQNKDDGTDVSSSRTSRESSPATSIHLAQRHNIKLASDKGHTGAFNANVVAQTAAERFAVLEERDKFLRSKQASGRQSNLLTAEVVRGMCPDMCPEKERYMREDRRRLSVYEMVPGTDLPGRNPQVDHTRAVKEYSRSSADQDMPLPDELRPASVLNTTMNYLLINIMDAGGPGKWENWFDFLWNRTRGIRKDITQQQLCDLVSVSLVEKCTRFHIFCSAALCEEDMAVFDPKINNENLTKCLQTLKEMYADLSSKQNVCCPSEAEFRAYMVLMRLNDGDTLREVQQLRAEVRESDQVKFAVLVYTALNSHNYVKFFKLVHAATFLNVCILHRYFNQMRACCLQRLRAYVMPGHTADYPLTELMRLLAFEDDTEARELCEHHGLTVTGDGLIHMGRTGFVDPEMAFPPRLAARLIDSKQTGTVGEIVNGGPLPANVIHEPTSLFDDHGRYVGENVSPAAEPDVTVSAPVDTEVKREVTKEVIHDLAKQLFHEVIDEMCAQLSSAIVHAGRSLMLQTEHVCDALIGDFVSHLISDVAAETRTECTMIERELKARQRALASMCDRVATSVNAGLIDEFIDEFCCGIAQQISREMRAADRLINDITDDVMRDVVTSVAVHESQQVAANFHEIHVVQRLDTLRRCSHVVEMLRVRAYLDIWKTRLAGRRRLKRLMRTFPSAPSLQSDQFTRMLPDSSGISVDDVSLDVGHSVFVTLHGPDDVASQQQSLSAELDETRHRLMTARDEAWAPLDLVSMIHHYVPRSANVSGLWRWQNRLSWKLVIALPVVSAAPQFINFSDWLKCKFSVGSVPSKEADSQVEVCSLYSSRLEDSTVNVCVLAMSADISQRELRQRRHLLGTAAVIFLVSPGDFLSAQGWQSECDRLTTLLSLKPRSPRIPLCVLYVADGSSYQLSAVIEGLQLDSLLSDGLISDYRVYTLSLNVAAHTTLSNLSRAVEWLCTQSPRLPPPVETQTAVDYVEDGLAAHFFTPMLQDLSQRQKLGAPHAEPDLLIDWYNSIVEWLAEVSSHHSLQQLSWPVPEFSDFSAVDRFWNTEQQLSVVRETILSLSLPQFTATRCDWSTAVVSDVHSYICALIGRRLYPTASCAARLSSRIDDILRKASVRHKVTAADVVGNMLPWTDIITACVNCQLVWLRYHKVTEHDETSSSQLMVHYLPDLLKQIPPPLIHLPVIPAGLYDGSKSESVSPMKSAAKRKQQQLVTNYETIKHPRSSIVSAVEDIIAKDQSGGRSIEHCAEDSWADTETKAVQLRLLVEHERKQSDDFEAYLKRALSDSDCQTPSRTDRSGVLTRESVHDGSDVHCSLTEKISQLHSSLISEREADRLFEFQLLQICLYDE